MVVLYVPAFQRMPRRSRRSGSQGLRVVIAGLQPDATTPQLATTPMPSPSYLNLDTQVRLQDPTTKRWDTVGIVMGVGKSRDYLVKMPSGRVLWRNRRLLRPVPPCPDDPLADAGPPVEPNLSTTPQPRRSDRLRAKKDKKNAQDT